MSITSVITPNTTILSATEHEGAEALTEKTQTESVLRKAPPIVSCGVDALDNILTKIKPIDWTPYQTKGRNGEVKPPSEKAYLLRTAEQILYTADKENTPIVNHADCIYRYTGTHYKAVNQMELQNFLIRAAKKCKVPPYTAMYQTFVEKTIKQFMINSALHNSNVVEPETSCINLQNLTVFFDKSGPRFESHSPLRFVRSCLPFSHDPKATAPLWQKHLDRALPNPEKQQYLAMCLALPFYHGKIEKAPILYGQQDTGKSTTLEVFKALIGQDNFTSEALATLTKTNNEGLFARARLDGKLANIVTDASAKINDAGIAKVLISREEVAARHPYGVRGFEMRNYARQIFALNDPPHQFFTDAALTKRAAIILFDQQIKGEDIDTGFIEKIIETELPGVMNWIINDGLAQLLKTGRLDPPQCCIEDMAKMQREFDPVSAWLAEIGWCKGESHWIVIKDAIKDYDKFRRVHNYQEMTSRTLRRRLEGLGYRTDDKNHSIGLRVYYSKIEPEKHSDNSEDKICTPADIPF